MARSAILAIRIISDATKAAKGLQQVETSTEKFERRLSTANRVAKGTVIGLAAVGTAAFKQASELEQADGAVAAVFGKQSERVRRLAKDAADNLGLAQSEYSQMAAVFGSQLKNMGVASEDLVPTTEKLINLGGDLAATYGGSTKDAVEALGSLMRGERDPIERYGVGIKQADINARLAAQGQDKLTGAARKTAETEATLALLYDQTAAAQGQRAREADTAAVRQEQAIAKVKNAGAQLGTVLLPVVVAIATRMADLAGFIERNATAFQIAAGVVAGLATAVIAVNAAYKTYRATLLVVSALKKATLLVTVAQTTAQYALGTAWLAGRVAALAMATGMRVLNAAMRANPLGVIITAITVVAGLFVLAYKRSETFRKIVNGVARFVAGYIKTVIAVVTTLVGWFRDRLPGAANRAKSVAVTAFRIMTTGPRAVVAIVRTLVSWFSSRIPSAADRARRVAVSAIRLITFPIRTVINAVQSLIRWLGSIRWPRPPAWMSKAASGIGSLFGRGGQPRAMAAAASGRAVSAARGRGGPSTGSLMLPTGSGGQTGGNVIINVSGALDPVGVADQIAELLRRRGVRLGRPVGASA